MIKQLAKIGVTLCLLALWLVMAFLPLSLSGVGQGSLAITGGAEHALAAAEDFAPAKIPGLPSFQKTGKETGTEQIQYGVSLVTDWVRNVLGAIAILFLVYGGVSYVTARGDDTKVGKAKTSIMYAVIGLVVVVLAEQITSIFYPQGGAEDVGTYATTSARQASEVVRGVVAFAEGFVGVVAVAVLVYAGFLYVTARGEQSALDKAKKSAQYAIIGLFVVALSDFVVNNVFYPPSGELGAEQVSAGVQAIEGIVNFALGFVGVLATAFIIYGGFLYITAAGEPDRTKKATTIIRYAVVGIMIIMISYAIVGIVINSLTAG